LEHGHATFEIETSKAIGIQLIRHRSFAFQEFSQRYQDVNRLGDIFEPIELRAQCEDNRQSSTEVIDPQISVEGGTLLASDMIGTYLSSAHKLYNQLLKAGVAREQARMVLPLATTTKIHMTGSIRSWIHFLELRDDEHAQKEIQDVAKEIKHIFISEFPIISKALNYE
jgi:thymidylate synthase (FAD)